MEVRIFDVEHGGCALVTTDNGDHLLIDAGHNSNTGWRPSIYLSSLGIRSLERLIITNMDEDHASDLQNLRRTVEIGKLYRNPTVGANEIRHLKGQDGIGYGIESLAQMMTSYTAAVSAFPDLGGLTIEMFWNEYPNDFVDENNLSMVCILRCHDLTICFPGDMEVQGWNRLLERPDFRMAMASVNVLVASHHGRRNGCCEALYVNGWRPQITIISDSGIEYATQETVAWYRARTLGVALNGSLRRVLTTRRDGRILLRTSSSGSTVQVGI